MGVRITTLGNPTVFAGDTALPSLPGKPISFGLLVYLGVEVEATRDRLTSLFWPDSPEEKARHALSQALYDLRQALGEDWMESGGTIVRTTPSLWTDAREFEALVQQGRRDEALSLYGGHFLENVHLAQTHAFEDWVGSVRARLSRRHRATVDAFIEDRRKEGDLETALKSAWKWVGLDPLDDGGQHHLIQLLAETGSRTEALNQFERYRKLLEAELSLEPLEETVELVKGIRGEGMKVEKPQQGDSAEPDPAPDPAAGTQPPVQTWPSSGLPGEGGEEALEPEGGREGLRQRLETELPPTLEVLRPIGHGSMAQVFLAREPHLKRLVAVKVLSPDRYDDPGARRRFEREAQSAARINHPNVCTVHTVGSLSDGTPYLVSPFVKGTTLAQRLKAEGRLGTEEVRQVIREMASALAAAHKLGIIHRDVRPDNVLREEETGRHFLSDFGIAGVLERGDDVEPRITVTGELLGDPAYISPEHVEGKPLTDRADIYSLGIMAHQLLTGHTPPPAQTTEKHRTTSVIPPDLSPLREYLGKTDPDLVDLVTRCLAMDPASRPAAADIARKCDDRARNLERLEAAPSSVPRPAATFLSSLMERRFLQILGAFIVGGWLLIEFTDQLERRGILPEPANALAWNTVAFGFIATNILAWCHGSPGKQEMTGLEKVLLALVGLGWVVGCVMVMAG